MAMAQKPFPLVAPRSTQRRLDHFDDSVYVADSASLLYKFVDALCGTTGAGAVVNEIFMARANAALDTIYFNELDAIFGSLNFLSRSPAESYPYNPQVELLTSEQWGEIAVKDEWYRSRIRKFFIACSKGGTPEGIRHCVQAAVGVDCDIYEIWRYIDNFGIEDYLGRAPTTSRSEVVVRPHKDLHPGEIRLLRDMLGKIMPMESITTINSVGVSVSVPLKVTAATADSTYYEVQRVITPTPLMSEMPPPEMLPIDLLTTEQWMYSKDPTLAPYAAFNMTSEYGYHYLAGNTRSPIDTVTYGTLQSDGSVKTEENFALYQNDDKYTEWMVYEKADSPDNYPGGKYGLNPQVAPALNADRTPYRFPHASQADYVSQRMAEVTQRGGIATRERYRLAVQQPEQTKREFLPEYAIAAEEPTRDSTVSKSITRRRYRSSNVEARNPIVFAR